MRAARRAPGSGTCRRPSAPPRMASAHVGGMTSASHSQALSCLYACTSAWATSCSFCAAVIRVRLRLNCTAASSADTRAAYDGEKDECSTQTDADEGGCCSCGRAVCAGGSTEGAWKHRASSSSDGTDTTGTSWALCATDEPRAVSDELLRAGDKGLAKAGRDEEDSAEDATIVPPVDADSCTDNEAGSLTTRGWRCAAG